MGPVMPCRPPTKIALAPLLASMVLVFGSSELRAAEGVDTAPPRGQRAPEPGIVEVGAFAGVFVASERHEMLDATLVHRSFERPSPDFGLRVSYQFTRFIGVEAEAALLPLSIVGGGEALGFNTRAHFILQVPGRFTPFAVVGAGALGLASSEVDALGHDLDAEFHWGLGAKAYLTELLSLRLDGRHILAPAIDPPAMPEANGVESHFEILVGLSFTFGRAAHVHHDSADATRVAPKSRLRVAAPGT